MAIGTFNDLTAFSVIRGKINSLINVIDGTTEASDIDVPVANVTGATLTLDAATTSTIMGVSASVGAAFLDYDMTAASATGMFMRFGRGSTTGIDLRVDFLVPGTATIFAQLNSSEGTSAPATWSIITREKGDLRYAALANAWPGVSTATSNATTSFPVGDRVLVSDAFVSRMGLVAPRLHATQSAVYTVSGAGDLLDGTWRSRGAVSGTGASATDAVRVA